MGGRFLPLSPPPASYSSYYSADFLNWGASLYICIASESTLGELTEELQSISWVPDAFNGYSSEQNQCLSPLRWKNANVLFHSGLSNIKCNKTECFDALTLCLPVVNTCADERLVSATTFCTQLDLHNTMWMLKHFRILSQQTLLAFQCIIFHK